MFEDTLLAEDLNTRISFMALIVLCVIIFFARVKARSSRKTVLEVLTSNQKIICILSFITILLAYLGFF